MRASAVAAAWRARPSAADGSSRAPAQFHIEGYSYGGAKIISSSIGGYTYSGWTCVGQNHAINYAPGISSLTEYCDTTDGYVVLKLQMDHYIYFFSITYVGSGFSDASPPRILGVYKAGSSGSACGPQTCAT